MKKILLIISAFLMVPGIALAARGDGLTTLLTYFGDLVQTAIPVLISLAVLFFFYGLAVFILKAGDPEGRKKGIGIMIWGIVALFVIVSVWGLVAILQNTIGTNQNAKSIQGPSGSDITDLTP